MKYKLLRGLRVLLACAMLLAVTSFFLDFDGKIPESLAWLEKIQFVAAILAGTWIAAAVATLVATLLVGRLYCSVVCPLGILQDVFSWIAGKSRALVSGKSAPQPAKKANEDAAKPAVKPKKVKKSWKNYVYRKNRPGVRFGFLILAVAAVFVGALPLFALLDPYSIFGRIAVNVFKPIYVFVNNCLYELFQKSDSNELKSALYYVDLRPESIGALVTGLISFGVIAFFAGKFGRLYCNLICPVGTFLGIFSRGALFKTRIDADKCISCGLCAKACKGGCIDFKNKQVDNSRCVVCFDCFGACRKDAIHFELAGKPKLAPSDAANSGDAAAKKTALDDDTLREKERIQREAQGFDRGKRNFITLTALAATAAVAKLAAGALQDAEPAPEAPESGETPAAPEEKPADYGLLPIKREFTISPPGSETHKRMYDKCISCHLCVAKCPSHVLKPSGFENGLKGFLQPRVDFAHGFCNFDCTMCGDVCPTGAIRPLTVEEKHLVQMGHVVFIKENCIVYARDEHCGACSEHCPTQAVHMIPYGDAGLTIPETNVDLCVGCGGCEYICPARPHRAIYIEGNPEHVQATPPPKEETVEVEEVDFGF